MWSGICSGWIVQRLAREPQRREHSALAWRQAQPQHPADTRHAGQALPHNLQPSMSMTASRWQHAHRAHGPNACRPQVARPFEVRHVEGAALDRGHRRASSRQVGQPAVPSSSCGSGSGMEHNRQRNDGRQARGTLAKRLIRLQSWKIDMQASTVYGVLMLGMLGDGSVRPLPCACQQRTWPRRVQ